jgi:hypothetical protein
MRVVGEICRVTRESFGDESASYRGWVAKLKKDCGEVFSKDDVRRYEAAGTRTDTRESVQTINRIPDRYLRAIAPYTGYSFDFLYDIHNGRLVPGLAATQTLAAMLDALRDRIGLAEYTLRL